MSSVASPGMMLNFTPPWRTVGEIVSRMVASSALTQTGKHSPPSAVARGARIAARQGAQDARCRRIVDRAGGALEQRPNGRDQPDGERCREARGGFGGQEHGVVGPGHRAVAPCPMEGEPIGGDALLGDLDGVEAALADVDRDAAGFVDRSRRAKVLRVLLHEPAAPAMPPASSSAVDAKRMSRRRPGHGIARRIAAGRAGLGGEQAHDLQLHRDEVLHVDGAAAVHVAIRHVGRERVVGPAPPGERARRRGGRTGAAARRPCRRRAAEPRRSRARARLRAPPAGDRHPRAHRRGSARPRSRLRAGPAG